MSDRVITYNEDVVRKFVIAGMFWAVVAFLVGVYIAAELSLPLAVRS
jgi:cytochrome c oxidase cbb3-type subunit 1